MSFLATYRLLGIFVLCLSTVNAYAAKVTLVRALGPNADASLNYATKIETKFFANIAKDVWLKVQDPNDTEYPRVRQGKIDELDQNLSFDDQIIILETEIRDLRKSASFVTGDSAIDRIEQALKGHPRSNAYDRASEIRERMNKAWTNTVDRVFPLGKDKLSYFDFVTRHVMVDGKALAASMALIYRLEDLSISESQWQPLLVQMRAQVRGILVDLDSNIQIVRQWSKDDADKLAAISTDILTGSENPRAGAVIAQIEEGLAEQLKFTSDGYRYFTRITTRLMGRPVANTRKWLFQVTLVSSLVAALDPRFDQNGVDTLWAIVGAGYLGRRPAQLILTRVALALDKGIALIGRNTCVGKMNKPFRAKFLEN